MLSDQYQISPYDINASQGREEIWTIAISENLIYFLGLYFSKVASF